MHSPTFWGIFPHGFLTFHTIHFGTKRIKKFMFAAIAALVMVSVSNVFASSRMFSNAQVAPVDTVAPNAPSDSLAVDAPVQPQAAAEDSTQQETTEQKETTEQQTANQTATEQQTIAE